MRIDGIYKICSCYVHALIDPDVPNPAAYLDVVTAYCHLLEERGYCNQVTMLRRLFKCPHFYEGVYWLIHSWKEAGLKEPDVESIFKRYRVSFDEWGDVVSIASADSRRDICVAHSNIPS